MPYRLPSRHTQPQGQVIHFLLQNVPPPADRYIAPTDTMELRVKNPIVDVNITVGVRLLDTFGLVQSTSTTYNVKAGGTGTKPLQVQISEGFLLGAVIQVDKAVRGQCFVQLILVRGQAKQATILGEVLLQDYVTTTDDLSFPQSPIRSSLDGKGNIYSITGPDPGGANTAVVPVPLGVRWYVKHARIQELTSVADAFFAIMLTISDGTGTPLHFNQGEDVDAITAPVTYDFNDNAPQNGIVNVIPMTYSGGVLGGGSVQVQIVDRFGASTSVGPLTITVEEFVEDQ